MHSSVVVGFHTHKFLVKQNVIRVTTVSRAVLLSVCGDCKWIRIYGHEHTHVAHLYGDTHPLDTPVECAVCVCVRVP